MALMLMRKKLQSVICSTREHGDQHVTVTSLGKNEVRLRMPDGNSISLRKGDSYEFNAPPCNVIVTMMDNRGKCVTLGFDAQDCVKIHREEIFEQIQAKRENAA